MKRCSNGETPFSPNCGTVLLFVSNIQVHIDESGYDIYLNPSQIAIGTGIPYSSVKKCVIILRDNEYLLTHPDYPGLYRTNGELVAKYTEGLANYKRKYANQFGTYEKTITVKTR